MQVKGYNILKRAPAGAKLIRCGNCNNIGYQAYLIEGKVAMQCTNCQMIFVKGKV